MAINIVAIHLGQTCRIAIAGTGYVGQSNALLLAQRHAVVALNIDAARVEALARREFTQRPEIKAYLVRLDLDFRATLRPAEPFAGASEGRRVQRSVRSRAWRRRLAGRYARIRCGTSRASRFLRASG